MPPKLSSVMLCWAASSFTTGPLGPAAPAAGMPGAAVTARLSPAAASTLRRGIPGVNRMCPPLPPPRMDGPADDCDRRPGPGMCAAGQNPACGSPRRPGSGGSCLWPGEPGRYPAAVYQDTCRNPAGIATSAFALLARVAGSHWMSVTPLPYVLAAGPPNVSPEPYSRTGR